MSSIGHALNRRVTADEVREALAGPIADAEREEVLSLYRWFTTRYPSADERLAYVRQAYARWTGLRTLVQQREAGSRQR